MFNQSKHISFGCFQAIVSGLLGLVIYLSMSVGACLILLPVVRDSFPNPIYYPAFPPIELIMAKLAALAFSFLCVGPITVAIYIRYFLITGQSNPQDFASPEPDEKRKRS